MIGLGYVGLPLAVAFAETGFAVTGIDIDVDRVARLSRNESPVADVSANQIAGVQTTGHLRLQASYDDIGRADAIIICVPTPCTKNKQPDTSSIQAATRGIAQHLRPGQLIILRSTSYPGTTEESSSCRCSRAADSSWDGTCTSPSSRSASIRAQRLHDAQHSRHRRRDR